MMKHQRKQTKDQIHRNQMKTKAIITAGLTGALALTGAQAQQYPNPTTVAEVPGPAPGTAMTKDYVQTVGYWADQAILDGSWKPSIITMVK
jgi:hypothetical protein